MCPPSSQAANKSQKASQVAKTPVTLVATVLFRAPLVRPGAPTPNATAALFTNTSKRPQRSRTKSAAASTELVSATSSGTKSTQPPSCSTSAAASNPACTSRAVRMTQWSSSRARALAIAKPMPRFAPVTKTTLLSWKKSCGSSSASCCHFGVREASVVDRQSLAVRHTKNRHGICDIAKTPRAVTLPRNRSVSKQSCRASIHNNLSAKLSPTISSAAAASAK
mmetsp:Transcript_72879/g.235626  ORF Transcript_72879/g.235626 Transcript_72879/m.235626 type:complete len:223 (-) Transcript_72879:225-893(-)